MVTIIHADLELYLTGRLRADIAARAESYCQNVEVDNREPDPNSVFPKRLVIVRDLGGPDIELVTASRDVNISVLAESYRVAADLALMVHALVRNVAGLEPGNPVAAVTGSNGPFAVPEEQQRFRRLITLTVSVAGVGL